MSEMELSEYTPRILWFMSYALLGFDDVNRALHNAALRLMGLFWIFYFWVGVFVCMFKKTGFIFCV